MKTYTVQYSKLGPMFEPYIDWDFVPNRSVAEDIARRQLETDGGYWRVQDDQTKEILWAGKGELQP